MSLYLTSTVVPMNTAVFVCRSLSLSLSLELFTLAVSGVRPESKVFHRSRTAVLLLREFLPFVRFVFNLVRSFSHSIVAGDKHSFVRATVFLLSLELLSIPPKSSDGRTEVRTADAITQGFALREKSGGTFPQCYKKAFLQDKSELLYMYSVV